MSTLTVNEISKLDLEFLNLVASDKPTYNLVVALSEHTEKSLVEAALVFCSVNGDYGLVEKNDSETPTSFRPLMRKYSQAVCDFLNGYADTTGILKEEENKQARVMKLLEQETDILTGNSQISVAKALFRGVELGPLEYLTVKSGIVSYAQTCLANTLEQLIKKSDKNTSFNDWLLVMLQVARSLKVKNKGKFSKKPYNLGIVIEPVPTIVALAETVGSEAVLNAFENNSDASYAYLDAKKEFNLSAEQLRPLYKSLRESLDTGDNDNLNNILNIANAHSSRFLQSHPEPISLVFNLEPRIDLGVLFDVVDENIRPSKLNDDNTKKSLDDALCVLASVSAQVSLNRAQKQMH